MNCAGVFKQRSFVADREDADLLGGEPEREVAGVMFDEEADEPLVRAERRAVNAEGGLLGVVAVFVNKIKAARLSEIDLVGGDGEFAADYAPNLDINLWPIKSRFVLHLNIRNVRFDQNIPYHFLC